MFGQAAHTHQQKGVLDFFVISADFMATGMFIVAKFNSPIITDSRHYPKLAVSASSTCSRK
jgi:hypothetical protein